MSSWLRGLLLAALALLSGASDAHEMSMAEMEMRETSPGEFMWQWTATNERASEAPKTEPTMAPAPMKPSTRLAWPTSKRDDVTSENCNVAHEAKTVLQRYKP